MKVKLPYYVLTISWADKYKINTVVLACSMHVLPSSIAFIYLFILNIQTFVSLGENANI